MAEEQKIRADDRSSAARYRALLENMHGGVFLAEVGADVRVTYASVGARRMVEENGEALSENGGNALSMVYSEDLPLLLAALRGTAQSGENSELSYRVGAEGAVWRHIRLARLERGADGTATVIGVLTDMTDFKRAEEKLRQSEERYRIAAELSHALVWEVDITTHTLYQSVETSRALGHSGSVYHNVPDGLLATGTIHPSSVGDFRRMYADLYAGDDSREYMILSSDDKGGYTWVRAAFRIVRDERGRPVRSIGVAEKMPGAGREMRIFGEELRFADMIASDTFGVVRANLTSGAVEKCTPPLPEHSVYDELAELCAQRVHPDDRAEFRRMTGRENLLRAYAEERRWLFRDFRTQDGKGAWHWSNLAVNLLRQPVSGDIFAFGYCRRADQRRRWLDALTRQPERDRATMLLTKDALAELAGIAAARMPADAMCAVTVFEFVGFERYRAQAGAQEAQKLLSNIGHLCRIMIDGGVLVGRVGEARFAVFRIGVVSPDGQRGGIVRYKNCAKLLLGQSSVDVGGDIACGFAVSGKADFRFGELLSHAALACRIAQEQPGNPVTEYSEPDEKLLSGRETPQQETNGKKLLLIADDDAISRKLTRMNLEREYEVDEAEDGEQALALLREKQYALLLSDIQMPRKTGWDVLAEMQREKMLLRTPVIMITADGGQESEVTALNMGASDVIVKPIVPEVLLSRARNIIGRQEAAAAMERNSLYELRFQQQAMLLRRAEYDELTGLYNKQGFARCVRERLAAAPGAKFCIVRWDLDNFKMVNDTMGVEAGNQLLRDIGGAMYAQRCESAVFARLEADHFAIFLPESAISPEEIHRRISEWFRTYPFNFRLTAHVGVYPIDDPSVEVSIMCDRALLALRSVKGSFTKSVARYDESLRAQILEEQELSGEMVSALENGQFVLYFQPQINYEDGSLVGAETLVRWKHPIRGLIPPGKFIPLFERNGFITTLDEYIWEQSCRYMRRWLDSGAYSRPVSLSVNISRVDIYNPHLCEYLSGLVRRYGLPASQLRLEITESAYMQNPEQLISVVKKLHDAGFTVEMDDFGAGYSSLNTLKDVPVDMLKLDIRFLSHGEDDARGGSILSSVIRMAHWLDMPVIAEGVETRTQADYLKSLNCLYMQGYYFSKPVPDAAFEEMLAHSAIGPSARTGGVDLKGVAAFWDPSAQTALLFNSLVDGAAILEYRDGNAELLRANDRFYSQLSVTRGEYEHYQKNTLERYDGPAREAYRNMLETAIRTGGEAECEVRAKPVREGEKPTWIHLRVRLLAANADAYLFYAAVENVTARREMEEQLRVSRAELKAALSRMEQSAGLGNC